MEDEIRLIIVNGPPRAGKDRIAMMIVDEIANLGFPSFCLSISERLKAIAHELYGIGQNIGAFESVKDIPNMAFRIVPLEMV